MNTTNRRLGEKRIKLVIIDNILGAGKTTLINQLIQRSPKWFKIEESVSLSKYKVFDVANPEDREYFGDYTQGKIAHEYSNILNTSVPGDVILADRIFSSAKHWNNYFGTAVSGYMEMVIKKIKQMLIKADVKVIYIYLNDATPEKRILLANINKRGRSFEEHYTSEELNKLENVYKESIKDLEGLDYEIYNINLCDDFYGNGICWVEQIVLNWRACMRFLAQPMKINEMLRMFDPDVDKKHFESCSECTGIKECCRLGRR